MPKNERHNSLTHADHNKYGLCSGIVTCLQLTEQNVQDTLFGEN